ncbi:class V aminotransferase [Sulfurifustis variabilis]|uniref:Class V aminotransferase n=1 Tax=Sulfurifustis variabilis TaxID=1675686 RepID=A0A1B4V753_9GAMM|nr:aminotransferase class V-fold PLP-dependent enzyme [Sulfurifustis variabilis]BAU48422.1 class V aminotransferase [Sulfurifustis variabilis]
MAGNGASDIDSLLISEFPLLPGLVYLNHAAVSPWPRRTAETVKRFAEENLREGASRYPEWLQTERLLRGQLAGLVNAPSIDDIALLKNTSEGLSFVAYGLDWRSGDNVVITAEEFPSNRIVWESLASRGVGLREARVSHVHDPESAILEATDRHTRLVSVSSVQYASGLRLDLGRLGTACRERGIAFCVDAIQGLGVFRHDVQAAQIDFLVADGHKWLLGPEGIAVFYCRPEWRERLKLHEYGWHMVEDMGDYARRDWRPAAGARRFECGSPNMLGIHALSASLSLLLELGPETVERRVLERTEHLFERIRAAPSLDLVTPTRSGRYAGIVSFRHRSVPNPVIHERLRKANVVCAERLGGIRFSPHCYTPLEQLETAVAIAAG